MKEFYLEKVLYFYTDPPLNSAFDSTELFVLYILQHILLVIYTVCESLDSRQLHDI